MTSILTVFLLGVATDILWIKCTQEIVNSRRPIRAGIYSVALAAPGLFGFMEITRDISLAAPYLLGLFVGTIVSLTVLDGTDEDQARTGDHR
jgi:hypothetical protein